MVNTCVCCGAIIPEGHQICFTCSNSVPAVKNVYTIY